MRVIRLNTSSLQYVSTRRLANTPGFEGMIVVKFTIDEFGKVLFCVVESSTMSSSEFDQEIADKIKGWEFGHINKPGDVTQVIHPFVFKQQ